MKKYLLLICLALIATSSCTENEEEPGSIPTASISNTIPVLYIETHGNQPVTSKTEYIDALYWLDPLDNEDIAPLGSEEEPLPMQIRGRGHSSWKSPKKPYKLQTREEDRGYGYAAQ